MNPYAARLLIVVAVAGGISWTIYARTVWRSEWHTTSCCLARLNAACPQIGLLIVLLAVHVLQDALPGSDRWVVLLGFVAAYVLGHALWTL